MGYEWRYTYSVQLQLNNFIDTAYIFSRGYLTLLVSSQKFEIEPLDFIALCGDDPENQFLVPPNGSAEPSKETQSLTKED